MAGDRHREEAQATLRVAVEGNNAFLKQRPKRNWRFGRCTKTISVHRVTFVWLARDTFDPAYLVRKAMMGADDKGSLF